jgi:hypothetical protein
VEKKEPVGPEPCIEGSKGAPVAPPRKGGGPPAAVAPGGGGVGIPGDLARDRTGVPRDEEELPLLLEEWLPLCGLSRARPGVEEEEDEWP